MVGANNKSQMFNPERVTPHMVIHVLHGLTSTLLMQERHQAVAWQPHPSLFQPKLVQIDESSIRLLTVITNF